MAKATKDEGWRGKYRLLMTVVVVLKGKKV
jgi:hypothetical protein